MSIMNPDPAHPGRPQHPFFFEMSTALIANDNEVEAPNPKGEAAAMMALLGRLGIDWESLIYSANQRALRSEAQGPVGRASIITAWVDGFTAAMRLMHNRNATDGQHR